MPLFRYKAIEAGGRGIIKGIIDADSLVSAKERLQKQKILVTSLDTLQASTRKLSLTPSALLAFTREMAQLLKAGLPLYESLLTIEEKQKRSPSHALFADLCDKLKAGSSLSLALSAYPSTFSLLYLSMIRSAEKSGGLAQSFEKLADLLTKQQKLKKQLFSALAYPAFLGAFCLLVVSALFFFVIPSMEELFEGKNLHPLTQIVLGISHFLRSHALSLSLALGTGITALFVASKQPKVKQQVEALLLKTPLIKEILLASGLIKLFRSLPMLLSGGVPLLEGIHHAKTSLASSFLEPALSFIETKLVEGKPLSELFATFPFIPPLVVRMLHIGEETGNMATMMQNLANIYEEDLDRDLTQIVSFLQPALLLILGAIVGLVVLSILLPLTDVSSFTSS